MPRPLLNIPPLGELGRKLLAEAFGTFVLVFVVAQVADLTNSSNTGALAVGFTLTTLAGSLGHISGAHVNPAVTLGVWLSGFISHWEAVWYVLVQFVAGMLAALLSVYAGNVGRPTFPAPKPATDSAADGGRAFVVELIGTLVLASTVLQSACSRQRDNHFYPLVIGCALSVFVYADGDVSGSALNPVVATSLQVMRCFFSADCQPLKWWPLYVGAELLGGLGGFVIFCLLGSWHHDDLEAHGRELEAGARTASDTGGSATTTSLTTRQGDGYVSAN